MRSRNGGFTLVELLVVAGIIAMLLAMLLPTVNRAHEQANQVACMSNIHQVATAFILYTQDNGGWLPSAAHYTGNGILENPADFLWWQQVTTMPAEAPNRDVFASPIMKYLGFRTAVQQTPTVVDFNELRQKVLRCPSDVLSQHADSTGTGDVDGPYYYSYTLNNLMQSLDPTRPQDGNYLPLDPETQHRYAVAGKLARVRSPSQKVLLVEESSGTIDDGSFDPTNATNLLSVRHDHTAQNPPDSPTGFIYANGIWTVWNANCRGNVAFADAHVEYAYRSFVDDPVTHATKGEPYCCNPLQ